MSDDVPLEVTEAAGDWHDRLSANASATERRAFADWLLRSPVHVEEFLRLGALREEIKGLAQPDWIADLLGEANADVFEMPRRAPGPPFRTRRPVRRRRLAAAASVAAAVVLACIAWLAPPSTAVDPATVATTVGEQRSMVLSDGSTITLNTDSLVDLRITATSREVDLLRGEVLFDVAKDPHRPFRVTSGDITVESVATRFSVYRRLEDTLVAVVEGRVAINWRPASQGVLRSAPDASNQQSFEIGAGQQVALSSVAPVAPTPVDPSKVTAWTERRVVFENETLEAVVAEFNRYNRMNLRVGDPGLAKRRITGSFDVNDIDHFISVLDGLEPIRVEVAADGHRALHLRREP
ncbi:MAG: FecR domain-containing protein [Gammaproteobacteria bacterium]|nr:FecR domain-containing protein [Gammaproteobacteria bacterium]MDE0444707.1 FecR domain-containing protein [Gammaproteobacteria bacterium]